MSLDSSDIVQPTMPTLARAETLARQAYAAIRSSIWSGVVAPGVFYSEVQLAGALKISRTPVREALIQLAREGLVEIVPQRGFRLRAISDKERQEAFELRDLVEQYVVRRLANEVTDNGKYVYWNQGYIGPIYTTAINLTILQLENGALPIYQR